MRKIYSLLLFSLLTFFLHAQELTIKGSVTVQPDALLFVEGDVQIDNGGTLDIQSSGANRGQVQVDAAASHPSGGSWVCNGTTSSTVGGEGEVKFLGDVSYTASGSSLSFPNLVLQIGSFTGANENLEEMHVTDSMHIARSLDLIQGRMVVDANDVVYVANSDPDAIKSSGAGFGENYSNFVVGTLRREIAVGANNFYKFPIGFQPEFPDKKGYNPAFIDLRNSIDARKPANATSIAARFVVEDDPGIIHYYNMAHTCYSTTSPTGQFLDLQWMVKDFGYWDLKPNGNPQGWMYAFYAKPDLPQILNYNSNLDHLKVVKAPHSFTVDQNADWTPFVNESGNGCDMVLIYNNNEMRWKPSANATPPHNAYPFAPTDSIRASELTTFSRFGLSAGTGVGLPIELLTLTARPVDNSYIKVEWATATETDNAGFEVHRSTDGVNFSMIGWVPGNGTTSQTEYYFHDDRDVVANQLYYYRLRQVDFNGNSELTYVVTAMITPASTFVISEFIPNPTQNNSHIQVITTDEKNINVTVYNTLGQIMSRADHRVVPGTNRIDFNFELLADGTYYAIFFADNEVFNRKIILTK